MQEPNNVEAIRIFCFYLLARENDLEAFQEKFEELTNALRISESKNAELYYNYARLFSRFCGRNPEVIKLTMQLLEQALLLQPDNPAFLCEIGLQCSMIGSY